MTSSEHLERLEDVVPRWSGWLEFEHGSLGHECDSRCYGKRPAEPEPEFVEVEAARLVRDGHRQKDYGHPRGDFDTIAALWAPILKTTVTAEQVALCMIALKMARLTSNPAHHDSLVDVIGYAICYDRLSEPLPETQEAQTLLRRLALDCV